MPSITTASVTRFVAAGVPAGKPHQSLRDGDGLVLRLLPSGSASWQYVYRRRGYGRAATPRTITLGAWPGLSVKQATAAARQLAGEVAAGKDPRADVREAKRKSRAILADLLDDYAVWIAQRRIKQHKLVMSALRRGLAHLLHRDVTELDRRALVDAIERITNSGRPGAAAYFRRCCRSFLNRQLQLGVIVVDPLAGHRMPAQTKAEFLESETRSRALNEAELVSVWHAARELGGSFGGIVMLILLTGLRRSEASHLRWSWVDRLGCRITVPGMYMKSGRSHPVVVTALLTELLDQTPRFAGGDLLFPAARRAGGNTAISGWSTYITRLRRASGVPDVTLHMIRRTFRSILADIPGIGEPIAEALIAHRRSDLVNRYSLSEQWALRVTAANQYDAWLSSLLRHADHGDEEAAENNDAGNGVNVVATSVEAAP